MRVWQKWKEKLKEQLGITNVKSVLGAAHMEDIAALKERVTQHLAANDYQWIRPTMWKSVFGSNVGLSKRITA